MIVRTILAALTAIAIAGGGWAQIYPDRAGDRLGELVAPAGGKAYRSSWTGPSYDGFIEVSVAADGSARLRTSWQAERIAMQAGDLAGFEAELARAGFAAKTSDGDCGCLDECAEFFLAAADDRGAKRLHVCSNPLRIAVNELGQIADLRTGGQFAAPAPWWTREGLERPLPSLFRTGVYLPPLQPIFVEPERRTYRLVTVRGGHAASAISLTLFDDRRKPNCRGPVVFSCPSTIDAARLGTGPTPTRRVGLKPALAFEASLFGAGFSTLPAEAGGACEAGEGWVLEALIGDRYRAVAATSCDPRGLAPAVEQLRRLARR